jgi:phosphatidate cytidylyltransferase
MAPAAIVFAYLGGWWFLLFWLAAGCAILWEWSSLVAPDEAPPSTRLAAGVGLAASAIAFGLGLPLAAAGALLAGCGLTAALAPDGRRSWAVVGVLYGAALVFAPVVLRGDAIYGLAAILMLFAIVWATDIAAYFGGRLIGGPKLWLRVSPNKTWSGALAGALAGMAAGVAVAWAMGVGSLHWIGLVALALSAFAQAGDLFESVVKRRFGAKDASQLIPGHGGLMDRLDGFVAAALLAAIIGLARGGLEAPSAGLMIW